MKETKQRFPTVQISPEVLKNIKKHIKKTGQTIKGFIDIAATKEMKGK